MTSPAGHVNANGGPYNERMASNPDLLVVGGGIIGLTAAYLAAEAGLRVELFDRADLGQEASWAGAGILPPGDPDRAATPLDRLRSIGSVEMPQFSAALRERTGIDNGYCRCGAIEFLGPSDRYAVGVWDAQGIRNELLSKGELEALEPGIAESPRVAYHLPDCAQVRNPRHMRALVTACERAGVRLRPQSPVAGWSLDGSRIAGLRLADGEIRSAGRYLLAAGAWSEGLLKPLGQAPGVHPVLGQIVLLKPSEPVLSRVLMLGKEYLVPRCDGRVLVGSTEEPEAGFEKRTTNVAIAHLRELATRTVPALGRAAVEKCWAGLRPCSPDGLPYLGSIPGHDNAFVSTGHARAGVQLSLGSARLTVELLCGRASSVPLDAFRLDRRPDVVSRPTFRS